MRDGVGKAPLLDAAAQNGVNSSTLSGATWWLWELVAGFVVLFCEEKKRELCENTGTVCDFFGEHVFDGVEGQIVASNL